MINIRWARECDLKNMAELEQKSMSEPWSFDSFLAAYKNEASKMLVAENAAADFAGFAVGYFSYEQGELPTIAVEEAFRGNGVGACLLSRLLEEARSAGVEEFFLEVRPSNKAALHLYEKAGFEQIGIRKNFYSDPVEDALLMKINL